MDFLQTCANSRASLWNTDKGRLGRACPSISYSFEDEDDQQESDLVCISCLFLRGDEQNNSVVGMSFGNLR